ncbi:chemoreceptor glutamine deamidase CheD [Uliginosibacterium sp. H1]|uniref:chemoreceptor glutamine deamidase CheD n=1 Tax=Uliginosibacterium sp. H1 TaxID=3114757 RepID=UPI002E17A5EA|nr:chemoreceptor glutamine deamidase CheD [Uliginosibacterium sp. H1]
MRDQLAGNRYFDRGFGCEAVKVLPGEYYVTGERMAIVTVLGSCVSACVRDRVLGVGGLNHFMLPDGTIGCDARPLSGSARYGVFAMEILINHLLKLGAQREHLEAKVFGGGRVMAKLAGSQVGERNAEFVLDYLRTEKIPLLAEDLGDIYPRKVYFFPATGRVMVKRLIELKNGTVVEREREYAQRLNDQPVAGIVELF